MSPVIDVALPTATDVPVVVRSFAACLAGVTETPLTEIPQPRADLKEAVGGWRTWLAGRGAGLVPIADPGRFNWPGYWIAVLLPVEDARTGDGASAGGGASDAGGVSDRDHSGVALDRRVVLMFGTPAGVVLSPQAPELLGQAAADLPVSHGYLLASFSTALAAPLTSARLLGTVEAIAVAEQAEGPVELLGSARALAGRGLEGDRYARKSGTFTPAGGSGHGYDLTLIEAEVLDDLLLPDGRRLGYAEARRNLVTRGIDLNALVGRRFRVGDVECLGQRLCEPCAHLERLTTKGTLRALIHRGGLRADILTDGQIGTGAQIQSID